MSFVIIVSVRGFSKTLSFVGKDVASALGYKNSMDALMRHVGEEDKQTSGFTMAGQKYQMTIINESGLYSLIFSSKLISAMTRVECGIPIQRVDNEAIFQGYRLAFPENKAELDAYFIARDEYWNWYR